MKDQRKALKVKIKSLAEEARIIRLEERRALGVRIKPNVFKYRDDALYLSLKEHRTRDVREESRYALLAYAYIRGKRFDQVEKPVTDPLRTPNWDRVRAIVEKFGGRPEFKHTCPKEVLLGWAAGKEQARQLSR